MNWQFKVYSLNSQKCWFVYNYEFIALYINNKTVPCNNTTIPSPMSAYLVSLLPVSFYITTYLYPLMASEINQIWT